MRVRATQVLWDGLGTASSAAACAAAMTGFVLADPEQANAAQLRESLRETLSVDADNRTVDNLVGTAEEERKVLGRLVDDSDCTQRWLQGSCVEDCGGDSAQNKHFSVTKRP